MTGNSNESTLAHEVAELENLLAQTKTEGNRRDLQTLLTHKQQLLAQETPVMDEKQLQSEPMEDVAPVIPEPVPVKVASHIVKDASEVDDLTSFTEISRFGWEDEGYGKDKVSVYIMSGVDGVGDLPKENVKCTFTKTSFDLKILGLHGKNYRLVKHHLDKEIVPSKSAYRVKKNRVTIMLWKADKNNSWMNLTEKNPGKSLKPKSDDPAAGIMDMMKNMYDEGDDEMKRTIAKAWTESRQKTAAQDF